MLRIGRLVITSRLAAVAALNAVVALAALTTSACAGGGSGDRDPQRAEPAGVAGPGAGNGAAAKGAEAQGANALAPVEISIVGTSDLHGRLGALPVLGGYLRALRAARQGRVVLVDAGDMFQGTLESNLGEGETVVSAYKALGYNAVAIGNHEFDYGPVGEDSVVRKGAGGGGGAKPAAQGALPGELDPRGALKARAAQAAGAFPMLAANLHEAQEDKRPLGWPNVRPRVVVELAGGVRVGVIGVTTMSTPKTTIAANFEGLAVSPIAEAIAREAPLARREGADIVVVAAHAGGSCKRLDTPEDLSSCDPGAEIFEVARALPPGLVDVIVAGHTHSGVAHRVAGVPIVESFANGTAFGRVDITWDPAARRVTAARIFPPTRLSVGATYEEQKVEPAEDVAAICAPAIERAAARRREALGVTLAGPFEARYRSESALGNLVASLMLELDPKADVAFTNGGGLRADLPAGPLTYGALYDALPFDNRLARVTMTGEALLDLVRRNLSGPRGILSVAGLRVEARCGPEGLAVKLCGRPTNSSC
jgi:5'-nucleotidase